jgi:L-iditol 2-dehydrogenase
MKAAVLRGPGLLELDDLPDPLCPEGGVLLEVSACAVCGTDIKMRAQGHRDLAYPRVLGHEMVGRIVEMNRVACRAKDDPTQRALAEGDLVQVWPGIACGKCRPCLRGADNRCSSIKIMGFNCDGGFAELLALPMQSFSGGLSLLPSAADPALAALAEPLACCINGQNQARVVKGDRVLICGGGPIGALHALLAELHGAEKIIVAERLPGRIRLLKRHTSATVVNTAEESLERVLAAEIGKSGIDVILTATPQVWVDNYLEKLLSPGGRVCIFSGPAPGNHHERIDQRFIHYHELTICGAYGCSSRQNRQATELLTSGKIRADWLITKRTNLAGIKEAFAHSSQRSGMKSVVCEN